MFAAGGAYVNLKGADGMQTHSITKKSSIPAAAFVLIAGTLLHFAYTRMGGGFAWCAAVNESTWEHVKLLYWPVLLAAGAEFAVFGRKTPGFWCAVLAGVSGGMVFMIAFFYTYTGILGFSLPLLNIGSFFLAVWVNYWIRDRCLYSGRLCGPAVAAIGIIGLVVLAALCIRFTFSPPLIALFRDPVSGGYGLSVIRP